MAEAAGVVLFPESAPRLSLSLAMNDDDGTGENLWEIIERNYLQPTSNNAMSHPGTLENEMNDPNQLMRWGLNRLHTTFTPDSLAEPRRNCFNYNYYNFKTKKLAKSPIHLRSNLNNALSIS